jgi:geranylgeranylglycerol-phosphate geranylgeranyltransferase
VSSASAWLALVRWKNALIAAAGVAAGAWWSAGVVDARVSLTALAAMLLTGVANAVNDIADVDIDRLAHPQRPLARGIITPSAALALAIVCSVFALGVLALVDLRLTMLTVPVLLLMWTYSTLFKRRGLPGNIVVAVLASLPFLYGAWVVGAPRRGLLLLLLATPLHFAREIAKDLDDLGGDAEVRHTVPALYGVVVARRHVVLAVFAFLAAVAVTGWTHPLLALLLVPTACLSALAAKRTASDAQRPARLFKLAMVCAIVALVVSRT